MTVPSLATGVTCCWLEEVEEAKLSICVTIFYNDHKAKSIFHFSSETRTEYVRIQIPIISMLSSEKPCGGRHGNAPHQHHTDTCEYPGDLEADWCTMGELPKEDLCR